jgi:hypothetical protein
LKNPATSVRGFAVDRETKKPVMRMQRLETLLRISSGLGWEVVTATAFGRNGALSSAA